MFNFKFLHFFIIGFAQSKSYYYISSVEDVIYNLPFISKILEKAVANRLTAYKDRNNLQEYMQSAFRKKYSTETAIIKVTNDILRAMDRGECTILTMLDLSAAFDTVDHVILLNRLQNSF